VLTCNTAKHGIAWWINYLDLMSRDLWCDVFGEGCLVKSVGLVDSCETRAWRSKCLVSTSWKSDKENDQVIVRLVFDHHCVSFLWRQKPTYCFRFMSSTSAIQLHSFIVLIALVRTRSSYRNRVTPNSQSAHFLSLWIYCIMHLCTRSTYWMTVKSSCLMIIMYLNENSSCLMKICDILKPVWL
jgi:hypothetical protein